MAPSTRSIAKVAPGITFSNGSLAALFDANGYVRFETRTDLEVPGISVSKKKGKDWLSAPGGVATLPGYFHFKNAAQAGAKHPPGESEGVPLREYDESEYSAVQECGT